MNNIKNHFEQQLKRNSINCIIDNNSAVCFFKEIEDKVAVDTKYLFVPVETKINQGSIIECLGNKWLVIQVPENYNNVYYKCIVRRVTHSVKFKFADAVYNFPSIIETSTQSIEGNVLRLPIGNIEVSISLNNISNNIDYGWRFISQRSVWKVEGFSYTEEGLLKLYCTKDSKNQLDDMTLEVANNPLGENIRGQDTYTIDADTNITLVEEITTYTINAVFKKNGVVDAQAVPTYISSNDSILSVDSRGNVGIKALGTAIVRITYNNTLIDINFNITPNAYTIETDYSSISIKEGETYTINSIFKKNGVIDNNAIVTYTCDDNIVTVSNNLIMGNMMGNTVVKIQYQNIIKEITVSVASIIYSIELITANSELNKGDTLSIQALFKIDGVIDSNPTVVYSSSDSNIVSVDSTGLITAINKGNGTINIKYHNVNANLSITVNEVLQDVYTIELQDKTSIIYGKTSTWTTTLKNNGIDMSGSKNINYSLASVGGVDVNTLASISSYTNTSVDVFAINIRENKGKYFILRAELQDNPSIFAEKQILIKSLL